MISQTIKKWGKAICPPLLLGLAKSFLKNFQQKNLEDNLIVYAPEGFATPLPPENNSWESDGVLSAHEQKWKAFNREVRGSQPFGFIYESDNFSNRYRVTEHNLNLTFAYVMSRVMLEILKKSYYLVDFQSNHLGNGSQYLFYRITLCYQSKKLLG
jgi:hypothetical protein